MKETLIYRLRRRAEIRQSITNRKSVQQNKRDTICELLNEAANQIEKLEMEKPLTKLKLLTNLWHKHDVALQANDCNLACVIRAKIQKVHKQIGR